MIADLIKTLHTSKIKSRHLFSDREKNHKTVDIFMGD